MSDLALKLNDEHLKGAEKRGTLLSYFAETAKIKIKAIKLVYSRVFFFASFFVSYFIFSISISEIIFANYWKREANF